MKNVEWTKDGKIRIPEGKYVVPYAISGLLLVDKPIEVGDDQVMRFTQIIEQVKNFSQIIENEHRIPMEYVLTVHVAIPIALEKRWKERKKVKC